MDHSEVERRIRQAYDKIVDDRAGDGRASRHHGYEQAIRHRSKFESCGRVLTSPHGHEVVHFCRRAVCPGCATFWGRKLGRALVAACPDSAPENYRMVTLIFALVPLPDDAFDLFRSARRALSNAVDYRRRAAGIDQAGWRAFGLAGTLELDSFEAENFGRLGSDKQAQYRALGFVPEQARGSVWVATAHLLVHAGALGEAAVVALFGAIAPVVHVQGLHADRSLVENAERVVGYAAKVQITTTFSDGEARPWPLETVASYVAASMRFSHGRQAFKLVIKPRKQKKIRSAPVEIRDRRLIEPMPVVI